MTHQVWPDFYQLNIRDLLVKEVKRIIVHAEVGNYSGAVHFILKNIHYAITMHAKAIDIICRKGTILNTVNFCACEAN